MVVLLIEKKYFMIIRVEKMMDNLFVFWKIRYV